jgi:hypothetical protein
VWAHAVVAPFSDFPDDFEAPDCPRWTVHGRGDLTDLAGRLADTARRQVTHNRPPTDDDVHLVAEILAGRSFGARDLSRGKGDRKAQRVALLCYSM